MKIKIIRIVFIYFFLLNTIVVAAQSEYLAEIGVNVGESYYLGDANPVIFKNQQLNYGFLYRHNFNERFSAHTEWNSTKLLVNNFINTDTFKINMIDFCGEFNFFDIIKRQYKPQSKSFSPYIFTGISAAYNNKNLVLGIPFGIGFKYKIGKRYNLNAKWASRLLLKDNIDGIDNPILLNGVNKFNNDLISTFTIGISYNFWNKPCNCNNNINK